ncbi:hypothetical protein BKA69DRAFT_1124267 [Paraphysoderma sedebokerense]|nr:hypothetical protein BKA69DRAFT_1124267 [Paraphysoderma sedebokerense]
MIFFVEGFVSQPLLWIAGWMLLVLVLKKLGSSVIPTLAVVRCSTEGARQLSHKTKPDDKQEKAELLISMIPSSEIVTTGLLLPVSEQDNNERVSNEENGKSATVETKEEADTAPQTENSINPREDETRSNDEQPLRKPNVLKLPSTTLPSTRHTSQPTKLPRSTNRTTRHTVQSSPRLETSRTKIQEGRSRFKQNQPSSLSTTGFGRPPHFPFSKKNGQQSAERSHRAASYHHTNRPPSQYSSTQRLPRSGATQQPRPQSTSPPLKSTSSTLKKVIPRNLSLSSSSVSSNVIAAVKEDTSVNNAANSSLKSAKTPFKSSTAAVRSLEETADSVQTKLDSAPRQINQMTSTSDHQQLPKKPSCSTTQSHKLPSNTTKQTHIDNVPAGLIGTRPRALSFLTETDEIYAPRPKNNNSSHNHDIQTDVCGKSISPPTSPSASPHSVGSLSATSADWTPFSSRTIISPFSTSYSQPPPSLAPQFYPQPSVYPANLQLRHAETLQSSLLPASNPLTGKGLSPYVSSPMAAVYAAKDQDRGKVIRKRNYNDMHR